jgi:transcriptional regulator with GAF, ATPase, and Fis domain
MSQPLPAPEFRSLTSLLLRMSDKRTVQGVIDFVVEALIASRPHQASVGIWLVERDQLVLRASGHQPDQSSITSLSHAGGGYQVVSLDDPLLGTNVPEIRAARTEGEWPYYPDWALNEGIIGFGAAPIRHRGTLIGQFVVFLRYRFDDLAAWEQGVAWTRVVADYLATCIANARAFEEIESLRDRLAQENEYLREESAKSSGADGIIGTSPVLLNAINQASLVASTDASVLIQGESGTGKELFAQLIHNRSPRAGGPLIRVNCAAIPHDLFESEFFGHSKGSFTGAQKDRVGRFKLADGGTLFLDEVGEIPLDLQGKLLRVLQDGVFEAIGEERSQRVNVRIVAATNRDLKEEVMAKRFRQDLYYRLSVFPISLPPLRDRPDDIAALASHFLKQAARRFGQPIPHLKKSHVAELQSYSWPGNIRELQHVIERALIGSRTGLLNLGLSTVPASAARTTPQPMVTAESAPADRRIMTYGELEAIERQNLEAALSATRGKVSGPDGAAATLGINPSTLASKLKKFGLKKTWS